MEALHLDSKGALFVGSSPIITGLYGAFTGFTRWLQLRVEVDSLGVLVCVGAGSLCVLDVELGSGLLQCGSLMYSIHQSHIRIQCSIHAFSMLLP